MRKKILRSVTTLTLLAVAVAVAVPALSGQGAGDKNKSAATRQQRARELPVVDFAASANTQVTPQRRAKGRRYDLTAGQVNAPRFVLKESEPDELYELVPSHAPERSALPAAQSDAVVVGEVTGGEAHLSNDRSNVYSEFTLKIEEVLKNSSKQNLSFGSELNAERRGGAVRFPSGKILRRGHILEMMPLVGRRYVLFLQHHEETESVSIITGYELRDGRVFPLDGVNLPEGSSKLPQFAVYEGVEESAFLSRVRAALTLPASLQKSHGEVGHDNIEASADAPRSSSSFSSQVRCLSESS